MDHFQKLRTIMLASTLSVSIYEIDIPHDVDHHGMIRLNLKKSSASL